MLTAFNDRILEDKAYKAGISWVLSKDDSHKITDFAGSSSGPIVTRLLHPDEFFPDCPRSENYGRGQMATKAAFNPAQTRLRRSSPSCRKTRYRGSASNDNVFLLELSWLT
jgi:hypothetical protein